MIFKYKAISASGDTIEGFYDGNDKADVVSMLKTNNYYPISVEKDLDKEKSIDLFRKKVKKKDIAIFCRQFYTMLDAGLGIVDCIDILEKQTENKSMVKALEVIHEDVQKGQSLSDSMKRHYRVFPDLLVNMVEAGELSGNLDTIMERMSQHYEKENKLENKIKASMTYPIVLGIVSIGVVVFLLVAVMPTFIGMFDSSGENLPGPTKMILGFSNSLTSHWYIYTIFTFIILIASKGFQSTYGGKRILDGLKLKLPLFKETNIKIVTSRFTRTLSILTSSGIPLLDGIEMLAKLVGNTVVEDKLGFVAKNVQKGVPLSRATREIGVFPPMVDSMIKIGEESGAIDEILFKTADFYDDEVETALNKMTSMLEPLMIVVMAVVIGFIVIAMALPMFDVINTI